MKNNLLFIVFFAIGQSFCAEAFDESGLPIEDQIITKHSNHRYGVSKKNSTGRFIIYEKLRENTYWRNTYPPIKDKSQIEEITKEEFDTIVLAYQHQKNKKQIALAKKEK